MTSDAVSTWWAVRGLLLPYDGSTSEVAVLDVPLSACRAVLDRFVAFVEKPEVVVIDSQAVGPRPFDSDVPSAILAHAHESSFLHVVRGVRNRRESVAFHLQIDSVSRTFDAEFVFFADQLFPDPTDEAACLSVFGEYFKLVESIRSLSPASACVLSKGGNPRTDRGKPWVYFW